MNWALQIFLYLDVFVIGALSAVAIRHAYAHFRPVRPEPKPNRASADQYKLPEAMREKLLEKSSEHFSRVLDKSAQQLEHELSATGERINVTIKKLAADIITKELQDMQTMMRDYKQQTETEISQTRQDTDKYREDLKRQVAEDIEAEKQQLMSVIDNKLYDVVMSFLMEALQHDVDLGAQSDYLVALLDEHKDEFKQALTHES